MRRNYQICVLFLSLESYEETKPYNKLTIYVNGNKQIKPPGEVNGGEYARSVSSGVAQGLNRMFRLRWFTPHRQSLCVFLGETCDRKCKCECVIDWESTPSCYTSYFLIFTIINIINGKFYWLLLKF